MADFAAIVAVAAPALGLEPDWIAAARYGGVGVVVGVVGAMWSQKSRRPLVFLRLITTSFVIGGGLGAAFAE